MDLLDLYRRTHRPCRLPVEQLAAFAGAPWQTVSVGMLAWVWSAVAMYIYIFFTSSFPGQYAWHDCVAYKRDMCMQHVSHRPSIIMAVSSASAPRLVRVARPRGARARREHRLRSAARGAGPPGAAHARHQTGAARRAGQVCARQGTLCVGLAQASTLGSGCMPRAGRLPPSVSCALRWAGAWAARPVCIKDR